MMFNKQKGMSWGALAIGVLSLLLFVGGPEADSHRIYQELWDGGHLLLFAVITLVLLNTDYFEHRPLWWQFGLVTAGCLILGLAIEILQLAVGRSFDFKDVVNDVLGGYIGLAGFVAWSSRSKRLASYTARVLVVALCLIGISPVIWVVTDHYIMQDEFPALADFETPFELSRWDTNLAQLAVDENTVRYGKGAMQIRFLPGEYPDITLKDFVADWRGFKSLRFSLYSTEKVPLQMELKIYDRQHQLSEYEFSDRFNLGLVLKPGWNDIAISLDEVRSAPQNRALDMSQVVSFSLFLEQLNKPVVMYFDGLHLSTKALD